MKPSIALLHYSAPPIIGGVESTLAEHARQLSARGYAVKLVAGRGEMFDPNISLRILPLLDSQHPFVLQVNEKLARGVVPGDFYALTAAISRVLARELADVDICIAHNVATLHKNLALTSALHELVARRTARVIAWCHDFAWDEPLYQRALYEGLPWNLLREKWEGVAYVVVSETRRRELARLFRRAEAEIAVVPPGVDALEFLGIGARVRRWVNELDLLDAAPLLLLPARVTRRKNIEFAIEITSALRARGLKPKLLIMGPLGPHNPTNRVYLDELKELRARLRLEGQVIFLQEFGAVDDAARRDLYALADVMLLTSLREGFGIPILEAGLARLPIFCADIPPFRESARADAHYFGLDESPDAIAARIGQFLDGDARYRLKQRVTREYAWSKIFEERVEPLFKEQPNELPA
jgi:glycosyltransferase involved in cell wall biosynthesis